MSGLTTTGLEEGDGGMGRWRCPVLREHATTETIPPYHRPASGEEKCFHFCSNATGKWSCGTKLQFGNGIDVNQWDPKGMVWDSLACGLFCFFPCCFSWLINNNISLGGKWLKSHSASLQTTTDLAVICISKMFHYLRWEQHVAAKEVLKSSTVYFLLLAWLQTRYHQWMELF